MILTRPRVVDFKIFSRKPILGVTDASVSTAIGLKCHKPNRLESLRASIRILSSQSSRKTTALQNAFLENYSPRQKDALNAQFRSLEETSSLNPKMFEIC